VFVVVECPDDPGAGLVHVRLEKDEEGWYAVLTDWRGASWVSRDLAVQESLDGAIADLQWVFNKLTADRPVAVVAVKPDLAVVATAKVRKK
jgi:hypothetical protein